ncbi:hypothetical protein BUE80_DR002863 [Diplocarpon rosae]|nr:hypothetical protein BUE80_DR002863 [Diplocarpon rosae]
MSAFSFSFSGDDIEETHADPEALPCSHAVETGTLQRATNSAFPIAGQSLLQPQTHKLENMLKALPSKIVYSTLAIKLDDGTGILIPRRELWDVRVQLMAEEDDEGLGNLGKDDVKTGVYEGGFKSWESSVDVVKVLHQRTGERGHSGKVLELGCGTALPSLAVFQWLLQNTRSSAPLSLGLADYNPTVLQLVTLPNILLSWAQVMRKEAWESEGELELDEEVIKDFLTSLETRHIRLSFFSGAWGTEFAQLVKKEMASPSSWLTIIGAETIYSPAALNSFAETLMILLDTMPDDERRSLVAAKKVYFGVGGSMEDFCNMVRTQDGAIEQLREDSDGYEKVLGQRPILSGSPEDIVAQFNGLGAQISSQAPPPDTSIVTEDTVASGVPIRVYTPPGTFSKRLPVGVYYHGGGYLVGSLDSEDAWCRFISKNTPCILVSVEYRLSQASHKWPAQIDDSITAFQWAWENATKLGGDQSQVFTTGASAGGGLALGVADHFSTFSTGPKVRGVIAMVPVTAHPASIPAAYKSQYTAYTENATGVPIIDAATMKTFFDAAAIDPNDGKAFVVLSENLGKFPPTYIATCGKDPLRDDGRVLEAILKQEGVKTKSDFYEGVPHYFWLFPGIAGGEEFLKNVVKGTQWVLSQS